MSIHYYCSGCTGRIIISSGNDNRQQEQATDDCAGGCPSGCSRKDFAAWSAGRQLFDKANSLTCGILTNCSTKFGNASVGCNLGHCRYGRHERKGRSCKEIDTVFHGTTICLGIEIILYHDQKITSMAQPVFLWSW